MIKPSAHFSPCRKYRYALWRIWDDNKPQVLFVCLNPSTADEVNDDPTILKCIKFAQSWGFGGLCMANLFAFRATDPKDLKSSQNPVGDDNDEWLWKLSREAELVIAGWGNHGVFMGRAEEVSKKLSNLHCLSKNKSGQPSHPLYLRKDLKPVPYMDE